MISVAASLQLWLLLLLAGALDRLVGDPISWPHPVQAMGWAIQRLRAPGERWAGDHPLRLRLVGMALTALVVSVSGLAGWSLERLALGSAPALPMPSPLAWLGLPVLMVALASALAAGSLETAVRAVLAPISAPPCPEADEEEAGLEAGRRQLALIVGRDVQGLSREEVMRGVAETAAENAVDGLFGPLFWMLTGAGLWSALGVADGVPGPLSLAWMYKAASTLDSMLGYRRGRLRWLGTAGARLDDLLTWLPARLVAFSLPAAAGRVGESLRLGREALRQGRADPSPNAGVSMAAFALAAGVQLGGVNHYGGVARAKPILGRGYPSADPAAIARILRLTARLEALWLALTLPLLLSLSQVQ
ncbi:adenosylcobinamide-phosphate synthase CbiB [Synechococcus sp. BA-124 BA4]|nr:MULTISPECIES: adenosylcobinamide-phosphate synthase CbiB [unclassified Synechococcus]MEA5400673.1 adenosylcobinamide-phosphate synthase CbiB [Synechococcus sp. BA-124 BA4]QPN57251.1 cobalamin biosynthesis protein CobD [Synechococcus sp. CBW1107]CAK6693456.1 Cobalamin biosynthesis protein CobD [Synechococcus sp. CBW1107]